MNREKQKELIKEAMAEFFASTEGETIIGTIVCKALYQNLNSYEFEMEHTAPDGVKEAKIVKGDILKFIAQWIKNSEGAIRGAQADAAKARNRAGEALQVIKDIVRWSGGPSSAIESGPQDPVTIGTTDRRLIEETEVK